MSQALIMRNHAIQLTDEEKLVARKVFGSAVCGIDQKNQTRFNRFWANVFSLEPGEIAEVGTKIPRSGPFHRYHMAMEQAVFNHQSRFTSFDMFRDWLKIGCGFVIWVPGAKGGIVPLPKSIAYAELEEAPMRELHKEMVDFLRGEHASKYLWKHLSAEKAEEMIESILAGFER